MQMHVLREGTLEPEVTVECKNIFGISRYGIKELLTFS